MELQINSLETRIEEIQERFNKDREGKKKKKTESQINSLETKIEKMQERFNKDLEEIKKSQYIMSNAINEIKNTLEATNSRITEAEIGLVN